MYASYGETKTWKEYLSHYGAVGSVNGGYPRMYREYEVAAVKELDGDEVWQRAFDNVLDGVDEMAIKALHIACHNDVEYAEEEWSNDTVREEYNLDIKALF